MAKQRVAKLPVLIYCEGKHDAAFVRHVRSLYGPGNQRNSFDVRSGVGGGPISVVRNAARVEGEYALRVAKFDNDRGEAEFEAALRECGVSVQACVCTPSIEATMLEILESKSYSSKATAVCKRRFHTYIPEDKRLDPRAYDRLFPKELLEEARGRIATLDSLILLFEHGEDWHCDDKAYEPKVRRGPEGLLGGRR